MANRSAPTPGSRAADSIAALILGAGVWLAFATAGPPAVVPASAPDTAFSAARAWHDLDIIAAKPHPV